VKRYTSGITGGIIGITVSDDAFKGGAPERDVLAAGAGRDAGN